MLTTLTAILLIGALLVMLFFSRKTIKHEATQKAEETLEVTLQAIDNVMLSVEQAAGNIYWNILLHLDKPDQMLNYCRWLMEANPYISGAVIAMEPDYYKGYGKYFLAYLYRSHKTNDNKPEFTDEPLVQASSFGDKPYTEQSWYTKPIQLGHPYWTDPLEETQADGESIVTFSLPLYNREGRRVGVFAADIPLSLLSEIVLSNKSTPNSYCTLLSSDGSYIIHPDSTKLHGQTVYSYYAHSKNQSIKEAAAAMATGQQGSKRFTDKGSKWYVFYKPFQRSMVPGRSTEKIAWSVGVVYHEDDIYGEYNRLTYYVLAIAAVGIIILLLFSQSFFHRQLLPLRMLSHSAKHIAEGNYDDEIPESHQDDEIGQLQNHFQQMQRSLSAHVNELQRLQTSLQQQSEELTKAYAKAQEADQLKTTFLHKMTNQMLIPAENIMNNVETLSKTCHAMETEEASRVVKDIQTESTAITDLLSSLLDVKGDKAATDSNTSDTNTIEP